MPTGVEDLLWISVATVSKVLLIAITGILLATQMSGGRESVKGLGFYTVYVLLPCLLFTKLADNLSWDLLHSSFIAPLFGCVAICIGHLCGQFFKRYVPKPLQGHIVLACTCQNAVSFALSLLYSLKGVSWLDSKTLDVAQSYVFLYNLPISFGIWGIGSTIVRKSAKELHDGLAIAAGEDVKHEDAEQSKGLKNFFTKQLLPAMNNPPIFASGLAILVALTPPLKYLVHAQPLHTLMAGLRLVGDGCVPLQLLVLGCNLVGDSKKKVDLPPPLPPKPEPRSRSEADDEIVVTSTESAEAKLERRRREAQEELELELAKFPPKKLGLFVGFVRLIVVPSILFACLHVLYTLGLLGESKIFMLTMFIEICAPSAINASILVNLYNYRPKEYTEMLLTVYTLSIVTTTFWMCVGLYYINAMMG